MNLSEFSLGRQAMLGDTASGVRFDPLRPDPSIITIGDIATSLSRQPRFLGYTREPYSVAQHSVLLSEFVRRELALKTLLHDGAEAYVGDVIAPLKRLPALSSYRVLEAAWQAIVFHAFGLDASMPEELAELDARIRVNEARDLFAIVPPWALEADPLPLARIVAQPEDVARAAFLRRFHELTARRGGE